MNRSVDFDTRVVVACADAERSSRRWLNLVFICGLLSKRRMWGLEELSVGS